MSNQPSSSYIEKLRKRAAEQITYGGDTVSAPANLVARDCPNCGAGRAQADGLTHCAYCGFEFISTKLSDGIHLTSDDNS